MNEFQRILQKIFSLKVNWHMFVCVCLLTFGVSLLSIPEVSATNFGYLSITFDDNNENIFLYAYPILNGNNLVATWFVNTNSIKDENGTGPSWTELRELQNNGWEIGSHQKTHTDLDMKNWTEVEWEISGSYEDLVNHGLAATSFAYPGGSSSNNETTRALINQYFTLLRGYTSSYKFTDFNRYKLYANGSYWMYDRTWIGNEGYYVYDRFFHAGDLNVYAGDMQTAKNDIDTAISNGTYLKLLIHNVNASGYYSDINLSEFFSYVKQKVDAGQLYVGTYRDTWFRIIQLLQPQQVEFSFGGFMPNGTNVSFDRHVGLINGLTFNQLTIYNVTLKNKFSNPSFEEWSGGNPASWSKWSTITWENTTDSLYGTYSIQINTTSTWTGISQSVSNVAGGDPYAIYAYVKNVENATQIQMYVEFWDSSGKGTGGRSQTITPTSEWQRVLVSGEIPSDAVSQRIRLMITTFESGTPGASVRVDGAMWCNASAPPAFFNDTEVNGATTVKIDSQSYSLSGSKSTYSIDANSGATFNFTASGHGVVYYSLQAYRDIVVKRGSIEYDSSFSTWNVTRRGGDSISTSTEIQFWNDCTCTFKENTTYIPQFTNVTATYWFSATNTYSFSYNQPYPKWSDKQLISCSFSDYKLLFASSAPSGTTSTIKIYTANYTLIYIINTSFNLTRDFDSTSKILSVNVTHSSEETITVGFKNETSDPLLGNSIIAVDEGIKLTSIPTYSTVTKQFNLTINGTGTNKKITLNITNISTNYFRIYDNNQLVLEWRSSSDVNKVNSSYDLDYNSTSKIVTITIPTMSMHNVSLEYFKPDGSSCSASIECSGGYCVHGICRSSSTYCGDSYCDSGEMCSSCPQDCGICFCGIYFICKKENQSCLTNASCCSGLYCIDNLCRNITATPTEEIPKEEVLECPICHLPTEWSSCIDNKQTRTNCRCDETTNYTCQSYEEIRYCELIEIEKWYDIYKWYTWVIIGISFIIIVVMWLYLKIKTYLTKLIPPQNIYL